VKCLHIGCGKGGHSGRTAVLSGFINLDISSVLGQDLRCNAKRLSFQTEAFHLIYASHILEHFGRTEVMLVLREWVRVLKTDGWLRLSVPDFASLARIYQERNRLCDVVGPVIGGQVDRYDYHKMIFDEQELTEMMGCAGLVAIHKWVPEKTVHGDFWDYSQARTLEIPISLNLEGRKKGA